MQRLTLTVTDRKMERFGDTWRFRVRGNGILFEAFCHNHELQNRLTEVNDKLANSLRIVKHYAGYVPDGTDVKDMKKMLDGLSQTNTGIGIKIKDDPLPEFIRFKA